MFFDVIDPTLIILELLCLVVILEGMNHGSLVVRQALSLNNGHVPKKTFKSLSLSLARCFISLIGYYPLLFFKFMCVQVRSIARKCYRVFAKFWPDRARRVFQILDSTIQKVSKKN
jgi:hypothetical protein